MTLWCERCDNRTVNDENDRANRAKGCKWTATVPKTTVFAAPFALWPAFLYATTCPLLWTPSHSTAVASGVRSACTANMSWTSRSDARGGMTALKVRVEMGGCTMASSLRPTIVRQFIQHDNPYRNVILKERGPRRSTCSRHSRDASGARRMRGQRRMSAPRAIRDSSWASAAPTQ